MALPLVALLLPLLDIEPPVAAPPFAAPVVAAPPVPPTPPVEVDVVAPLAVCVAVRVRLVVAVLLVVEVVVLVASPLLDLALDEFETSLPVSSTNDGPVTNNAETDKAISVLFIALPRLEIETRVLRRTRQPPEVAAAAHCRMPLQSQGYVAISATDPSPARERSTRSRRP